MIGVIHVARSQWPRPPNRFELRLRHGLCLTRSILGTHHKARGEQADAASHGRRIAGKLGCAHAANVMLYITNSDAGMGKKMARKPASKPTKRLPAVGPSKAEIAAIADRAAQRVEVRTPSPEAVTAIADRAQRTSRHGARTVATMEAVLHGVGLGSSMTKAAKDAGVSRMTVWRWREDDEEFAARYADAEAQSVDVLRDEVWKRATGDKPSDLMLIFLMKQRDHSFRDNHRVELNLGPSQPGGDFDLKFAQFRDRVMGAIAEHANVKPAAIQVEATAIDIPAAAQEMRQITAKNAKPAPPAAPVEIDDGTPTYSPAQQMQRRRQAADLVDAGILHSDMIPDDCK